MDRDRLRSENGMSQSNTDGRSATVRVPAAARATREAVADAGVDVAEVGPTGIRSLDPLVTATLDDRTAFYPDCSPERAAEVATRLAAGAIADGAAGVATHDSGTGTLPRPAVGGLDVGTPRLLGGAGWRDPVDADDNAAVGGFVEVPAGDVADAAGTLLGRGWGDWCHDETLGDCWDTLDGADRSPAVVVNAHGNAADALLCESVPFEVLEGASLAARTLGADRVVAYLSAADDAAADRVREAAAAYPELPVPVEVVTGPAVYRAAEPTMALEAIEGNHRLEARLQPPESVPTLDGQPALVHTARTLAQLALAVRTGEAPTTRLVTVTGDVASPATVELSADATLDRALDAVDLPNGCKAAAVGGRFGGLTDSLEVVPTPTALADAGLGTEGGVEVLGEDRCVLAFAGRRTDVAAETNCGRCVPCREGSTQLAELLRDVYDGDLDPDGIEELARTMAGASVCEFGVEAARPARTALADFEAEVAAHADGRCPAGACTDPAEVT